MTDQLQLVTRPVTPSITDYATIGPVGVGGKPIVEYDPTLNAFLLRLLRPIKSVAASYTVTSADCGGVIVVTAAATISLPDPVAALKGFNVDIFVGADATVNINTVTANTDKLVVSNDAAADQLAFSTASQRIGNSVTAICDGTSWFIMNHPAILTGAQTAATPTITT